ncbi:helix-turn-helix domain-containing protein [Nocardia rhizosphaerihabitans]|uniref:helix-turn-helix domain-containing protein n=1 Tax=Nocardia rhizosphaerihabitans TaxID=1691570 RepID=UPI00166D1222|nr:helix-turn-helix domain-containing protein [Nocardia rhizosphaerihabitans]
MRVGQALDRITDGETSLADLAAHLGFADQAHLTRTVREHLGHTPTALHRLLTPPSNRAAEEPHRSDADRGRRKLWAPGRRALGRAHHVVSGWRRQRGQPLKQNCVTLARAVS